MELVASRWLERQGCRILERQFRTAYGEVDLIYQHGEDLVFGEVKYRASTAYGLPGEAVDARKQQRIRRSALWYCKQLGDLDRPIRFDVIELLKGRTTVHSMAAECVLIEKEAGYARK